MTTIKLLGNTDKHTQISPEDAELAAKYKWYLNSAGYAATVIHRKGSAKGDPRRSINIALHRLIMGDAPEDTPCIDHINRDPLDNRRENLRFCTHEQNMANAAPTFGMKGVKKDNTRWCARIRDMHLGSYGTEKEAALAYDKAARYFFKEFAYLNFPQEFYDQPVRFVDFEPTPVKRKSKYVGVSYMKNKGRVKRWRAVFRNTTTYHHTEDEAGEWYRESKASYEIETGHQSAGI